MIDQARINDVMDVLQSIGVDRSDDELLTALPSAGLQLAQRVGKRMTFADSRSQRYSVYCDAKGTPICVEATVAAYLDPEELSEAEYQQVLSEHAASYSRFAGVLNQRLGLGTDYRADRGEAMPHDCDAIQLTLWRLDRVDLTLELKQESPELPIRVVLTLLPQG